MDKKQIKTKLEEEKNMLVEQLRDIGKENPATGEWEAVPEEQLTREADQNDMADRFEDFESRSNMVKVLEARLNNIDKALGNLGKAAFGKCEVCKKEIETDRLLVNPAANTCKEHMNK